MVPAVLPATLAEALPARVPMRMRRERRCVADVCAGKPGILVMPKVNPLEGDSSQPKKVACVRTGWNSKPGLRGPESEQSPLAAWPERVVEEDEERHAHGAACHPGGPPQCGGLGPGKPARYHCAESRLPTSDNPPPFDSTWLPFRFGCCCCAAALACQGLVVLRLRVANPQDARIRLTLAPDTEARAQGQLAAAVASLPIAGEHPAPPVLLSVAPQAPREGWPASLCLEVGLSSSTCSFPVGSESCQPPQQPR